MNLEKDMKKRILFNTCHIDFYISDLINSTFVCTYICSLKTLHMLFMLFRI